MIGGIDDQQFLDTALVQDAPRILLAGADRDGGEIVRGHQLAHRLARIFREPNVAVGQDTDQLTRAFDDRDARDAVQLHQVERFGQRLVGGHRDRVDHHPTLEPLDRAHRSGLRVEVHVAVEDADAAELRQRDRHVGLGHGVHRR